MICNAQSLTSRKKVEGIAAGQEGALKELEKERNSAKSDARALESEIELLKAEKEDALDWVEDMEARNRGLETKNKELEATIKE